MAGVPFQLFFANNRQYGVGSITFDLIISEQHTFNNQIADHSVEDGSVITDHIKNELETGSLVGLISNFSINAFINFTNRAQSAFDALIDLWQSKQLVTIVTVMRVYDNVAIMGCSIARSSSTGEAIELNISFKKIRTVKLQQFQASAVIGQAPPIKTPDMSTDQNKQSGVKLDFGHQLGKVPESNTQLMTNITSGTR